MALSTYKVFLMKGTAGSGSTITWAKLVDIKDFPDLGGNPERIDATTLSDKMRKYVEGIQETEEMAFTANYTKTDYTALKALEGQQLDLAVWIGGTESEGVVTPTGTDGKFSWKGTISSHLLGGGVNEVIGISIVCTPNTVIDFE